MEERIYHYRNLITLTREYMSCMLSAVDNHILGLLLTAYASSMETAYSEYNDACFISKWKLKKRLLQQLKDKRFRQAIHIDRNVASIMRLPCVFSCHKDERNELVYLLYDWDGRLALRRP